MEHSPGMYTIGHSTHSVERFVALLRAHGIKRVGDVRRYPGSRRHPQFNAGSLTKLALERRTAIVCAEGDWRRCHRRLISDALAARGGGYSIFGLTAAWRSTGRRSSARFAALAELADTNAAAEPVWKEPVRGGYPDPAVVALPGRERLQGWRQRTWPPPPLSHLTGAVPTRFGDGTAEAEMPASGWLAASTGVISGGALAILADIAFGCSIETQLPAATTYTTAELSMSFLRPARPGTTLTAHGQAIHVGRSVALSEVFVLDRDSEQLIAHGTSRLSVFPPLTDPPEPPERPPAFERRDYGSPDPFERPAPEAIIPQQVWSELSGAEILRRQFAGELPPPPLHHLTGLRLTELGDGTATFALPASEWLASPARRLQGGVIAMQADFAMLAAAETIAAPGVAIAGLDLKANFLRPVPPDGSDLVARAEVIHSGRTIAITRAEVTNADGKPVLLATGSSMYLPGRAADLGGEVELGPSEG